MKSIQEITKFVEDVFDLYQLNKHEFFFAYDELMTKKIPVSLFPFEEPDDETLQEITAYIGLTKEEILNTDEKAARKYWDKYPFFHLYRQYMEAQEWHQYYVGKMPSAKERLIRAIFSEEDPRGTRRYDSKELRARLISTLKEIDKVIPGTYHKEAKIAYLKISTQEFFPFAQFSDMLRSFLDMVRRMEELFYAALHEELCTEDANELSFLASWLDAVDIVMPRTRITYDKVRTYRKAYLEENNPDFFSYVKIKSFIGTNPWCCLNFFDDMELVQDFFYIFPYAKAKMRHSAFEAATFSCTLVWSDAKYIDDKDPTECTMRDLDAMLERLSLPLNVRSKELTCVYIDKELEEMAGGEAFAERLRVSSGPTSQGGIAVPRRKYINISTDPDEALKRMQRRINAKCGGASNG